MARDIDFESLDDDDIQYLRQRSALVKEAELLGHSDIRKTVDEWEFVEKVEAEEYDFHQEVRVPPQVADPANTDSLNDPLTPASDGEEEETPPYAEWSKDELVAEAKERGLPSSGTKDELVARLDANDAEEEEEEL